MAQKLGDFHFTHLFRVLSPVKEDKAPNPIHIRFFGSDAVMLYPQVPAYPVEQFWLCRPEAVV